MPGPRAVQNLQMPHPRDWQGGQMMHFIQVIRKNLTQRRLSGILANTKSVYLGSFQGIGFQTYLIVFTALVMSDLLVFVSFLICWKRTWCTYHLSQALEPSFRYSQCSFPSPRTSSLWVKDNICYFTYFSASVLFLLSLERLIKRNAVCSSHFSPMSNQIV